MATEAQIAVVMLYLGLLFGKLSLPSNGPAKLEEIQEIIDKSDGIITRVKAGRHA